MNILTMTGNLTKDSVLRHTGAGKPVLGFTLANNQGYGDKQHTEYYECGIWGKRAESLEAHLMKGQKVIVTGEHRTDKREYNGKTYFDNRVFVREIEFAGSKPEGAQGAPQQSSGGNYQQARDSGAQAQNAPQGGGFEYRDMPF